MTMLKFLNQESRYRFIASGSQLGVALSETPSVPLGSISITQMYPLDFEEFLWGKDSTEHSALTKFLDTTEYGIDRAIVFSNDREIFMKKGMTYLPIYYCMFLQNEHHDEPVILPALEKVGE